MCTDYEEHLAPVVSRNYPRGFCTFTQPPDRLPWADQRGRYHRVTLPAAEVQWRAYRQLWLFAFRHFPEMTGCTPRKDVGKPRPSKQCVEHAWWDQIALLAERCGYRNYLFNQSGERRCRCTDNSRVSLSGTSIAVLPLRGRCVWLGGPTHLH